MDGPSVDATLVSRLGPAHKRTFMPTQRRNVMLIKRVIAYTAVVPGLLSIYIFMTECMGFPEFLPHAISSLVIRVICAACFLPIFIFLEIGRIKTKWDWIGFSILGIANFIMMSLIIYIYHYPNFTSIITSGYSAAVLLYDVLVLEHLTRQRPEDALDILQDK